LFRINIPNKWMAVFFCMVIAYVVIGKGTMLRRAVQLEGQWSTFDTSQYEHTANDPDGFRLVYPSGWDAGFLAGGRSKNLRELRASFEKPSYTWTSTTYLNIWWRRVDPSWQLDDALTWFEGDLAFGLDRTQLAKKHDTWERITIGAENYPALLQTFATSPVAPPYEKIILLVKDDEAFALTFRNDLSDPETPAMFERMLGSFEVYR
jgi:hypothetical protein